MRLIDHWRVFTTDLRMLGVRTGLRVTYLRFLGRHPGVRRAAIDVLDVRRYRRIVFGTSLPLLGPVLVPAVVSSDCELVSIPVDPEADFSLEEELRRCFGPGSGFRVVDDFPPDPNPEQWEI